MHKIFEEILNPYLPEYHNLEEKTFYYEKILSFVALLQNTVQDFLESGYVVYEKMFVTLELYETNWYIISS